MRNSGIRNLAIDIIAALLIFLFIYAAVSKLLDYQKFRVQLGQSPMLTVFAGWVAWLIPAIEIILAVTLAVPAWRLVGLYGSFSLMTMFTAYIIAITQYSEYVPCSCGGVLQHMSWDQHLIFNIGFVLLSLTAIILYPVNNKRIVATMMPPYGLRG